MKEKEFLSMNELNELQICMALCCLFPGCTPRAAACQQGRGRTQEIRDKERNASPRALDVSGEFYAVGCLTFPKPGKD